MRAGSRTPGGPSSVAPLPCSQLTPSPLERLCDQASGEEEALLHGQGPLSSDASGTGAGFGQHAGHPSLQGER